MDKDKGLFQKYSVEKLSNPEKKIDAIVLEFDDPLSRAAIRKYAVIVRAAGFPVFALDLINKCNEYEINSKLQKDQGYFVPGETYKNTVNGKLSVCEKVDEEKVRFRSCEIKRAGYEKHSYSLRYCQIQNYERVSCQ